MTEGQQQKLDCCHLQLFASVHETLWSQSSIGLKKSDTNPIIQVWMWSDSFYLRVFKTLYFGYAGLSCTEGICPQMYTTTPTHLASIHHPERWLNLWKISPVFIARSNRLMQKHFKVIFFIGKLQVKCMPQNQFHLSPNEAFIDSDSKLWCNKLLPANINEICWLVAKQVNPSMTVFHDQVHSRR